MSPEPGVQTLTDEQFRVAMLAAFAHELRTPLTAIRMVLDMGRASAGTLVLDGELAQMLTSSVDDVERLADRLHEQSRLERGIIVPGRGPSTLAGVIERARAFLPAAVSLEHRPLPDVIGPWDETRLGPAIAGLAEGAYRAGDGAGLVRLDATPGDALEIHLTSGSPGAESRPIDGAAGFRFFAGARLVHAAGGTVVAERTEGYCAVTVMLPLA